VPAVCIDLSSSGMQVQAQRQFAVGDRLLVRIESEHEALKGPGSRHRGGVGERTEGDNQNLGPEYPEMK
jgi:hypothetical protein